MATVNFKTNIDLSSNELKNAVIDVNSSDKSTLRKGQVWYNSTADRLKVATTTSEAGIKAVAYTTDAITPAAHTHVVADITDMTGAVSTITTANLTPSMVAISNGAGKIDVSTISTTKLGFLSDVTSNIQAQLTGKINTSLLGAAGGVATLDSTGMVTPSQIPGAYDDVVEGYYYNSKFWTTASHTVVIDEVAGRIYLDLGSNPVTAYRYGGSAFARVGGAISLGTATPLNVGTTASAGSSVNAAREDHVHILADGVVTAGKIANGAVMTEKIADGSINSDKLGSAVVNITKISELAATAANPALSGYVARKFVIKNPALTASGGECTWTIPFASSRVADSNIEATVSVIEVASGNVVYADVNLLIQNSVLQITIKFNSTADIAANTYKALIID